MTDGDQLSFVTTLNSKVQESATLAQQANHNSKEQFSNSPALRQAIVDALIDAFDDHSAMSKQELDSDHVREGLREILLGPGRAKVQCHPMLSFCGTEGRHAPLCTLRWSSERQGGGRRVTEPIAPMARRAALAELSGAVGASHAIAREQVTACQPPIWPRWRARLTVTSPRRRTPCGRIRAAIRRAAEAA